jgi:hypothetical protein
LAPSRGGTGDGVRNYIILCNGLKTGRLKLRAAGQSRDYKTAESEVYALVELWHARLFSHGTVSCFLDTIISLINGDTVANYERATVEMERRLVDYLWNAVKTPEGMPYLNMLIRGRPLAYFDRGELHEKSERFWLDLEIGRDGRPVLAPGRRPALVSR